MPEEFMQAAAGFDPKSTVYYLPRAEIEPKEELLRAVFPGLNHWSELRRQKKLPSKDISSNSFVRVMEFFRKVILQDAVLLKKKHPDFFLWNHPLFRSDGFIEFEAEMEKILDSPKDPAAVVLSQLVPAVTDQLKSTRETVTGKITTVDVKVDRALTEIQQVNTLLTNVLTGRAAIRLLADVPGTSPGVVPSSVSNDSTSVSSENVFNHEGYVF
jgi:hypothetical protein